MAHTDALLGAVARLARRATHEFDLDTMLRELCEVAASVLDVDAVGVMGVVDHGDAGRVRYVHADQPATDGVERVQEALQQGPCKEAVQRGDVVGTGDVRAEVNRWPEFTAEALRAGLHSVVALPLRSRDRTWATLDLYRHRTGEWSADELQAAELLADVAVSYLVMASDRDMARSMQIELEHRSLHDQLTGLPNRRLLADRLEHSLTVAARRRSAIVVVFIDLDSFKFVNDTYGHGVGDQVLVEVSRRMAATLREGDTLARFGGDEFVVVCEDLVVPTDEELATAATSIVERLQGAFAEPVRFGDQALRVTASFGVAVGTDEADATAILRDADSAMYAAKSSGPDRVVVHARTAAGDIGPLRRLAWDLGTAVERDELRLHYQPIFDRGGRIVAVEALLRWHHRHLGLLVPHVFLDLAESTGALPAMGRWVIEQACADLARWRRTADGRAPEAVFCNLNPSELADASLVESVAGSIEANGLEPADLVIEVVELAFADAVVTERLTDLRELGHPVSIDDFGTGHSSLSRLIGVPADYAKLDRSSVAGLPVDIRSSALVDAVLTVARSLDLRVIGEGVENGAQHDHLLHAGCDLVQGFHLARPMPIDDLELLLAQQPLP